MPDEIDAAQDCESEFRRQALAALKAKREAQLKQLPPCENHFDGCTASTFVTEKGTVTRFCKDCFEAFKREHAE
jgi:hypothetical protein